MLNVERQHKNGPAEQKGALLALIAIAAGHFIDAPLFEVNDFAFSFQKGLSLLIFPFSLLLMGRVYLPPMLLIFGLALLLSFSFPFLLNGTLFHVDMLKGAFTVLEGFVVAVMLLTALVVHRKGFQVLAQAWVLLGCASALLAIGQTFELVPLFFVPEEYVSWRETGIAGIYRGTGLKYDPNFLAMMLLLAVGFAQTMIKKGRWPASVILFMGILSTFSRMGVLVLLFLSFLMIFVEYRRHKSVSNIIVVSSMLSVLLIFFGISYLMNDYVEERTNDVFKAIEDSGSMAVHPPEKELTSGYERVLLIKTAGKLIGEHPVTGIGAYQEEKMIGSMIGITKSSHNIYLELPMVGGVMGWIVLVIAVGGTIHAVRLRLSRQPRGSTESGQVTSMIVIQISIIAVVGIFLSFIYYPILWFPLVLGLAGKISLDNCNLVGR